MLLVALAAVVATSVREVITLGCSRACGNTALETRGRLALSMSAVSKMKSGAPPLVLGALAIFQILREATESESP